MASVELKRTIVRRLRATDNTKRRRPMFFSIDPEGVIGVWPRRLPKAELSIHQLYIYAVRLKVEAAQREKARLRGTATKNGRRRGSFLRG